MKCYQCGQEVQEGQSFCTNCGYNMNEGATTVLDASNNPFAQKQDENATTVLDASNNPFVQPQQTEQNAASWFEQPAPVSFNQNVAYKPPVQPMQPDFGQAVDLSANRPMQPAQPTFTRPRVQHPTQRGLLKMIFLGLITGGIYNTVIFCRIVTELNILASRYDGRRTMPYFAMVSTTPITLGILPLVWFNNLCDRIGDELNRRGLNYSFSASTFWLWNILGSLIVIGPFVFQHKLMKAMNLLNADFNAKG